MKEVSSLVCVCVCAHAEHIITRSGTVIDISGLPFITVCSPLQMNHFEVWEQRVPEITGGGLKPSGLCRNLVGNAEPGGHNPSYRDSKWRFGASGGLKRFED